MGLNKKSTKISKTSHQNLPFMFANKFSEEDDCSTSSSYMKTNADQSFLKELSKMGLTSLSILEQNPAKSRKHAEFTPAISPKGRFPYQRNCRSISPPKDDLTISEKKDYHFFPEGSPVVPDNSLHGDLPFPESQEDDDDLLVLKKQYLKLVEQAPDLDFKSELFDPQEENFSGTDEFNEWEISIMKN